MCAQAYNETQLGRLNAIDVLKHLQHWRSKVAQSQQLEDMAEYLTGLRLGTGIAGTTTQVPHRFVANIM